MGVVLRVPLTVPLSEPVGDTLTVAVLVSVPVGLILGVPVGVLEEEGHNNTFMALLPVSDTRMAEVQGLTATPRGEESCAVVALPRVLPDRPAAPTNVCV